jgi:Domain of unknown function (DUF4177)
LSSTLTPPRMENFMRKKVWLLAIVAALVVGLAGWTGYGQRQQREPLTVWEYKVMYVPGVRHMSEKMMNELGGKGWELVTFQAINNEGGTIGAGNYFFKRARAGQP